MKFNPTLSALMLGLALIAPAGPAHAQPKPVELRYTSGAPPKGNPWAMQVERFVELFLREALGDRVPLCSWNERRLAQNPFALELVGIVRP